MNMQTILVPTDYSDTAFNALYYAAELALKNNAKLVLIHVYDIPMVDANMAMDLMSSIEKEINEQTLQDLEELMDKLKASEGGERFQDIEVSYMARHGFALEQILEAVEYLGADMIVMGTTGASGIKEYLIGSNAEKVLENARCPVLAIPKEARYHPVNDIVYASDLREGDKPALKQLAQFAALYDATIHVLHVFTGSEEDVTSYNEELPKWVGSYIEPNQVTFESVYGEDKELALDQYIKTQKADLLAMLTKKHNFFQRMFSSDLTKKMAYHTHIPLLAFQE